MAERRMRNHNNIDKGVESEQLTTMKKQLNVTSTANSGSTSMATVNDDLKARTASSSTAAPRFRDMTALENAKNKQLPASPPSCLKDAEVLLRDLRSELCVADTLNANGRLEDAYIQYHMYIWHYSQLQDLATSATSFFNLNGAKLKSQSTGLTRNLEEYAPSRKHAEAQLIDLKARLARCYRVASQDAASSLMGDAFKTHDQPRNLPNLTTALDLDARIRQRDTYGRKDNERSVQELSSLGQLQPAHVSIGASLSGSKLKDEISDGDKRSTTYQPSVSNNRKQSEIAGAVLKIDQTDLELKELIRTLKKENQGMKDQMSQFTSDAATCMAQTTQLTTDSSMLQQTIRAIELKPVQKARRSTVDIRSDELKNTKVKERYVSIQQTTALYRSQAEEMMKIVHTSGIYADNSPAFPDQFSNQVKLLAPVIRLYGNFVFGNKSLTVGQRQELNDVIPHFVKHVGLGSTTNEDLKMTPVFYRRAFFMASFSKLLFEHFENESFMECPAALTVYPTNKTDCDKQFAAYKARKILERGDRGLDTAFTAFDERTFVAWYDWYMRQSQRRKYAADCKTTMATVCSELQSSIPAFAFWRTTLIRRMSDEWTHGDTDMLQRLFFHSGDERIITQFDEVCKQVWALHALSLAFPNRPEIMRFKLGDILTNQYCTSSMSVEEDEHGNEKPVVYDQVRVVCTLLPGFQIDGSIEKADVIWANSALVQQLLLGKHQKRQRSNACSDH